MQRKRKKYSTYFYLVYTFNVEESKNYYCKTENKRSEE